MKVHGDAALGPAVRLALVETIELGMTLRGGQLSRSTWRRRLRTVWHSAGAWGAGSRTRVERPSSSSSVGRSSTLPHSG